MSDPKAKDAATPAVPEELSEQAAAQVSGGINAQPEPPGIATAQVGVARLPRLEVKPGNLGQ